MSQVQVAVIMGSDSDLPVMKDAASILDQLNIKHEILVLSAHRSPKQTEAYVQKALKNGVKVIIAAAGGAAHLAGVVAARSPLPVIGVPIESKALKGIDSLFSTVQMPPGIPVATVGINAAKNAAILAAQILATSDKKVKKTIENYKKSLAVGVKQKTDKLLKLGVAKYLDQMESKA